MNQSEPEANCIEDWFPLATKATLAESESEEPYDLVEIKTT